MFCGWLTSSVFAVYMYRNILSDRLSIKFYQTFYISLIPYCKISFDQKYGIILYYKFGKMLSGHHNLSYTWLRVYKILWDPIYLNYTRHIGPNLDAEPLSKGPWIDTFGTGLFGHFKHAFNLTCTFCGNVSSFSVIVKLCFLIPDKHTSCSFLYSSFPRETFEKIWNLS